MKIDVKLNDWDIFCEMFLYNDFRVGVLSEFVKYFNNFEVWEEDEKQEEQEKLVQAINEGLTIEEKEVIAEFLKRLLNEFEGTNNKPHF